MKPKTLTMEEKLIVGIGVRTKNINEMSPSAAQLAKLWGRFYQEDIMSKVRGKVQGSYVYGVYHSYESDMNGEYSVVAGVEVDKEVANKEFTSVKLKKGKYLAFKAKGEMPGVVIETWKNIWKYFDSPSAPKRAYITDYEVYKGPDEVAIYIGVK